MLTSVTEEAGIVALLYLIYYPQLLAFNVVLYLSITWLIYDLIHFIVTNDLSAGVLSIKCLL